jgi:hypothetical protein
MSASLFPSGLRGPFTLLAFGLAATSLSADELAGETVKLPDFTVSGKQELPPPESWQYSRLEDGTEVLSNAPERASQRMLRDFQMFQQALGVAWPALSHHNLPVARMLILCGRRDKFDDFTINRSDRTDVASTSMFVRNREQTAIVLDLQVTSLNLTDLNDDTTSNITSFEVDPYKQLYREYVRYLLSQGANRPPPWLQEGIAQIVMAMEFTPDWVKLGELKASGPSPDPAAITEATEEGGTEAAPETSVGDRPFNAVLQRRALIPMDKFFAVTADAPEATNPLGNNRWAKQAYAFVHLCLYGENERYKPAFETFIKRLETEPLSEALFKECFKMSYKDMLMALRGYIGYTFHKSVTHKRKAGSPKLGGEPVVMREATQAEIGRIKGDAQRLAGRTNDALTSYHDAYARGERAPMLLAAYGAAASETGQNDRALPLLEAAAKAPGTRRPSVYMELGRQRLVAAKAKPAAANGRLDDAQVAAVMEPLIKARLIRTPLPGTYETIAETWLHAATPPKIENFGLLGEGLRLFPRDLVLIHRIAELYQQIGQAGAANKLAQVGLHFSTDAADRARFEKLLASLPPPPAR